MSDPDLRLRDAGAHLRDTAPTSQATDAALALLGDVALDDLDTRRSRRWIIGPAVLAAAAAIIALVVVTRRDDAAIVPSDTTTVTEGTVAPTAPATAVPPTTVPSTTPGSAPPTPTTPSTAGTDLGFGVTLTTSDADFDGAGGACLTLATTTDRVSGCADGATMSSAYGHPLALRLDGTPYSFFPRGADGTGEPELRRGDAAVGTCFATVELPGVVVESAVCDGAGVGVLGVLPSAPDATVTWTVTGSAAASTLDLLAAAPDLGARVFRAPRPEASEACVVVVAGDSMREACGVPGHNVYGAGPAEAPLVVTADVATGEASLEPLDAATRLRTNDCGDLTVGELLALLPAHGMVDALLCGPDVGAVHVPSSLDGPRLAEVSWDLLAAGPDGTWSVSASEVDYTCTTGLAAEVCAELEVFDLGQAPGFPSPASVAGFELALGDGAPAPGRAAIEEIPTVGPAPDLATLAESVAAAMRAAAPDPDERYDVLSTSSPIVIRRNNLDDAVTATIFLLRAGPFEGGYVVFANGTRAVDVCGRGITEVDGETLCV